MNDPRGVDEMGHRDDPDLELITDYLANELAPAERAAVEERLRSDRSFYKKCEPVLLLWSRALQPMAAEVADEELPAVSAASMDRVLAGFSQRAGIKPGWRNRPSEPRRLLTYTPISDELHEYTEHRRRRIASTAETGRWNRAWVGIAATLAIAVLGRGGYQLAWVAPHEAGINRQLAQEDVLYKTNSHEAHKWVGDSVAPRMFEAANGTVLGAIHRGEIDFQWLGSYADSGAVAKLSSNANVDITLEPQARELLVNTDYGEIRLMEPGVYHITSEAPGHATIRVERGLAELVALNGTERDRTTVRTGESAKMVSGYPPMRDLKAPDNPLKP